MRFVPCFHAQLDPQRFHMAYSLGTHCQHHGWPPWWAALVAMAGCVLAIVIGPIFWLVLIRRSRGWCPELRQELLGHLVCHYKVGTEWWEVTVLMRKMALTCVAAMSPISFAPSANLTMALAINGTSMLAQAVYRPCTEDWLNTVESMSLCVSLVALLLAAYITSQQWSLTPEVAHNVLVLALSLLTVWLLLLLGLLIYSSFCTTSGPLSCSVARCCCAASNGFMHRLGFGPDHNASGQDGVELESHSIDRSTSHRL